MLMIKNMYLKGINKIETKVEIVGARHDKSIASIGYSLKLSIDLLYK